MAVKPVHKTSEKTDAKTGKPPRFKVYLLNDDYTTMEFVVHILETVFRKPPVEATQIMLHIHNKGEGLAGVYTKDIAETKIEKVHKKARMREFPLQCRMEKE